MLNFAFSYNQTIPFEKWMVRLMFIFIQDRYVSAADLLKISACKCINVDFHLAIPNTVLVFFFFFYINPVKISIIIQKELHYACSSRTYNVTHL